MKKSLLLVLCSLLVLLVSVVSTQAIIARITGAAVGSSAPTGAVAALPANVPFSTTIAAGTWAFFSTQFLNAIASGDVELDAAGKKTFFDNSRTWSVAYFDDTGKNEFVSRKTLYSDAGIMIFFPNQANLMGIIKDPSPFTDSWPDQSVNLGDTVPSNFDATWLSSTKSVRELVTFCASGDPAIDVFAWNPSSQGWISIGDHKIDPSTGYSWVQNAVMVRC